MIVLNIKVLKKGVYTEGSIFPKRLIFIGLVENYSTKIIIEIGGAIT